MAWHKFPLIYMYFRWFGLILLPLVSFAAGGVVATVSKFSPSPSIFFR